MASPSRDIAEILETLDVVAWNGPIATNMPVSATEALEDPLQQ